MGLFDRLKKAWNILTANSPPQTEFQLQKPYVDLGRSSTYRPDRVYYTKGQEKTLINAVYNRIAMDVASVNIRHVKLDKDKRFKEEMKSTLNDCLSVEANKDQTARAFFQDVVMSMFDEGCIAIVPIDYDDEPKTQDGQDVDILTMRVGRIVQWYPDYIRVEVYNDRLGYKQEITVPKERAAIIENPFYAIMNEPNSIMQRLVKKFNLLDIIDAQSGSGRLNLIIQLPYVIKTEARKKQAAERSADIEKQLAESNYGIAYTDGTEKITQLNRPAENNLMNQIQFLTSMLFSQLGVTEEILNGTADPKTMQNYMNRCVNPICRAIVEEMDRKFLTKTARTQGQAITYFNDVFKLIPVDQIPDFADKLTRNEIMSSNEFRQILGMKPSSDPKADKLVNKNISQPDEEESSSSTSQETEEQSAAKELELLKETSKNGGNQNE